MLEYYMNKPNFDYTKPNNLLYHIDNIFFMIFAAIVTTSRATTNAIFGKHHKLMIIKVLYI
jgi:hypothetical protein